MITKSSFLFILLFLIFNTACPADDGQASLPAIETFVNEPMVIENISIWVPAAKSGPFINRSCRTKENLVFSLGLPALVKHEKTDYCPKQLARILAELTSFYHSQLLPLTILNGWQWEYAYNMCQFESVSYDLARSGGSWENCWEAVLSLSCGTSRMLQLNVESLERFNVKKNLWAESTINVKTFSSMRTRNGYPKEKQL